MKVCGVEIKGSQVRMAILEDDEESFTHVNVEPKKLNLDNDESSHHVRSFRDVFQAIVKDQKIDHIAIKKRNKRGEYAGGATTFKIEGLLQLLDGCEVHLLSPATISSVTKKAALEFPDGLLKYQQPAFKTAFTFLKRLSDEQ